MTTAAVAIVIAWVVGALILLWLFTTGDDE
jgi:hypothetical protein